MDDAQAERYSMGAIPEEDLAGVEEHLLICEACQQRVADSDDYVHCLRSAARKLREARKPERSRAAPGRMLVMAFAALGLMSGVWMLRQSPEQRTLGPFAVDLQATRGTGLEAQAPPDRPLALHLNPNGLPAWPSYRVEIVDAVGSRVWEGAVPGAAVAPLRPGHYFARAYSPPGELLREYALDVGGSR